MKSMKFLVVSLFMSLCLFLVFGCSDDDDNGTGPVNTDVPDELVGTWFFVSATLNGESKSFSEVSFTDTSQTGSVTLNSNNTWSSAEYYNSIIVFTQSGTCSNIGHILTTLTTIRQGMTVSPPDTSVTNWNIAGSNLIMTDTVIVYTDTMIMIATYMKQ